MRSIGIDIGTGSVSLAVLENGAVVYTAYRLHKGDRIRCLNALIKDVQKECPWDMDFGAVNSAGSNCYPGFSESKKTDRLHALLAGRGVVCPDAGSIMEIGAQSSLFITGFGDGESIQYGMNGECAAGTGAFFEDQMYRLGLPLMAYSEYVERAKSVPRLAGRCSVFAKTDLIHRQQEGVPAEDILLGLAYAVIRNFKASVVRKMAVRKPVLMTGGVVYNAGVKQAVKEIFGLSEGELICDERGAVVSAIGLAAIASEEQLTLDWKYPVREPNMNYESVCPKMCFTGGEDNPVLKENAAKASASAGALPHMVYDKDLLHVTHDPAAGEDTWLGIDVGSTSTNLVWIGAKGQVLDYQYLRTQGDPCGVVTRGLQFWKEKYGETFAPIRTAVTGSGRYLIAKMLETEHVLDEITAQARASAHFFEDVDTVFEIGGQDSKYISVKNGQVVDFEMNKVCAAGTGSFVEEQADRLGVSLEEIGYAALRSENPVDLGERCTVLMESRIAAELAEHTSIEDICAGLCKSIVKNYLNRVVGNKKIGSAICLQGGIVHNEGIVAAFHEKFGDRIKIMPYYDVTGAYGAALEAKMAGCTERSNAGQNRENYQKNQKWFLAGYDGTIDPAKKTIGIPRSLMIYKFFPMAYQYFSTLGYNVLLSQATDEEIIGLSQELVQEETCYPVKLMHGHMESLARKGVDYIFIPCVRTIKHDTSNVKHNYGCVYMQTAPKLAAKTLRLKERGIELLTPVLDLDMGKPQMAGEMIKIGVSLGKDKIRCTAALAKGAAAMMQCEKNSEKLGREIMASLKPDDKVLVLVTRNYGISDPVLNMGIPEELLKRGCKVLTLAHLQAHDLDLSAKYPNLYWPFSQHILSGAEIIKNHPNLYAVYLTNHGCGPDTMISHLFQEVMGEKPYLSIEVDEHQSAVGVVTRIEAFLNSLKHSDYRSENYGNDGKMKKLNKRNTNGEPCTDVPLIKELTGHEKTPVFIPALSVYSRLAAEYLKARGYHAEVLPEFSRQDLNLGKSVNRSKESCEFSAIAGQCLLLAERMKGKGPFIYVLPQTEGAEVEGFLPQVMRAILKRTGNAGEILFYSPKLEDIVESKNGEEIWNLLLRGDILLRNNADEKAISRIAISGSPLVLYSSVLNRDLFDAVRDRGFRPEPMMLTEYLWYWLKDAGRPIPQKWTEMLEETRKSLNRGDSVLSSLEDTYSGLAAEYPRVTGGNVWFFCQKAVENGDCLRSEGTGDGNVKASIVTTPAYANSSSILELMRKESKMPFFHYQVDGNDEQEEIERREIFLNLLEAKCERMS